MAFNIFRRKKKQKQQEEEEKSKAAESKTAPAGTMTAEEPSDAPTEEEEPAIAPEMSAKPPDDEEPAGETAAEEAAEEQRGEKEGGGFYGRLRRGLSKTRRLLTTDIEELIGQGRIIDQDTLDELEERLITSDIGVQAASQILETVSGRRFANVDEFKDHLKHSILSYMAVEDTTPAVTASTPHVIMMVGVNGVGKTTTIGKLAAAYGQAGLSVLLVAADTFRAAAVEQLEIWAQRAGADVVKHRPESDPAAVAFDGIEAARARKVDIVIIDTAGRLHTKTNLMEELKKIKRTVAGKIPEAPHEVLLVLDATTGQNAISQAKTFTADIGISGLVLTKLDGSARGGMAVNLCHSFQIPLRYIGVGEEIDDLQPFQPKNFVEALF